MRNVSSKFSVVFIFVIAPFCVSAQLTNGQNITDNIDSTQIEFEQKIKLASNDSLNLLETYFAYGEYLDENEKPELSVEKLTIALRISQNANNYEKTATIANYLANVYVEVGNFNASNNAYIVALESAEKIKNPGEIAKISMNLASNYNFTGDYEKAIQFGLYALKTKETANNLERICYHYISMGSIFKETNNVDKWNEYTQKAYKLKDVEGCASISDIAKIYNNLGGIAEQKNELDKALCYYDTLLTFSRENNFETGICTALTNSADIYKHREDYQKALDLALESEEYFSGNPYDEIFNNNFKAELYRSMGQEKPALELALQNIGIEEINYYSTEKLKCLQLLYELNVSLANYKEAFVWNDSLRETENRLRDEEIIKSIEELETKYETEKKEQQINLLTTENELKNQRLRIGIILLVVLVIVIFMILYILQIRRKQALLVQNDLKQKVLRSQMNPHFIFNVLGSIQNFLLSNDNKKAAKYLSQFASLTRSTLEYSASNTISLTNEIAMLTNYMELEKMRKPGRFDFEIIFDENLEIDFIEIPPMMIQPFIENAIKHGFKEVENDGLLQVAFSEKKDLLHIEIKDNGLGINAGRQHKGSGHKSMAMQIFDERCKLFFKKTKHKIVYSITDLSENNQQGTKIEVIIPLSANM